MPITKALRAAAALSAAVLSIIGCNVRPQINDVTGSWTFQSATLSLQPDRTFTTSNMPCGLIPFGCPNDSSVGPPISGSGTWHILIGQPRSLKADSNSYTQVVLTFRQMRQGSQQRPGNAETSLIVQHGKGFELYGWAAGEIDPESQWHRTSPTSK